MSLQLLELDNDSFSQELEGTFQQEELVSFEATKKKRNSRRTRKPVAIKNAEKRVRDHVRSLKKARTHLRVVRNRHR